ncbi:MAG: class I SAM-dependent methyltransferase [Leptolyngbyaceae cyanobacterium]
MNDPTDDLQAKIREQFDSLPYPAIPIATSPKTDYNQLFIHNLVTPYYLRNQQVIATEGKVILDAGCGSGYKSLMLAEANPGAKIVGIDLSEASVNQARERLRFHGFDNVEFHCLPIAAVAQLGLSFDYINCDEVLYLFDDIGHCLQQLRSVLKPEGILRGNLHSALQRNIFFRAQEVFKLMGLLETNPGALEAEIAVATITALKDEVDLKAKTWNAATTPEQGRDISWIFMNYLFQGDKGYTITDLFAALRAADLEFISMVNWRQWELLGLFQEPDDLPLVWAMSLPELSVEQRLRFFELLHPIHRLLDFWCGHPDQGRPSQPVADYSQETWQQAMIYLHPQLRTAAVRDAICDQVSAYKPLELNQFLSCTANAVVQIPAAFASGLLPLWEGPQTVQTLVQRFLAVNPCNPVTLAPLTQEQIWPEMISLLTQLEVFLYLLVEGASQSP